MHRHFMHRFMHRQHGQPWQGEHGEHAHRPYAGHDERGDGYEFHGRRGRGGPFGHHDGDVFADWNGLQAGGRRGGGRLLGHGDLKLLLLALIEQQPRHGYELIRTIEDMFHGHYTPSPGAVYPTLTMLEELGHATVASEQNGRKLYAITADGRAFLDANRPAVEAMTERNKHSARMLAKMTLPMSVRKGMHALKHAVLMRSTEWNKAEATRVATILERAAAEIATGEVNED